MPFELRIDPTRIERVTLAIGNRVLRRRAERIAALARVYASSHGTISEGIIVVPDGLKAYKIISTNVHTQLVHDGSPRHEIRPRRGRYLRFTVGGRVVFARVVNHPGYRGDPFLTNALRDA